MGQLVEGAWRGQWSPSTAENTAEGRFVRENATFRRWVRADGSTPFRPEAGRYHLYAALICPWASRALIYRKLKKLDDVVSVSIVHPVVSDFGWEFADYPGTIADTVHGARYLHEVYTRADPKFTGRVTVPALWDKKEGTIVNNESSEIIRMFDLEFGDLGDASVCFYPEDLRASIDELNAITYDGLNNGVYRAGFASSQEAYEEAIDDVFRTLDLLEERLDGSRYLLGDRITEADWRVFVTLVRFDAAYYGLFKCNLRRIIDYPRLRRYTRDLYEVPGVAETVDLDHIKRGYYGIKLLNPRQIVPGGPGLDFRNVA